jgi:ATP-dependent DNA helicase DinG
MAAEVARTLGEGGVLLAEAGTGTGKTLAYLVPAVALRGPVVISTGTRALQDQLVRKDVPLLAALLGRPLSVVMLKGRRNYLCLLRFAEFEAAGGVLPLGDAEASRMARDGAQVARWAAETETGDRAEVPGVAEDAPVWERLTVGPESCLGGRCTFYGRCFVTRARARAAVANVVVVNHHLYFGDLAVREAGGQVLPDHEAVIFDEAHAVPDIAAAFFGTSLSSHALGLLLGEVSEIAGALAASPSTAAILTAALAEVKPRVAQVFGALRPFDGRAAFAVDALPEVGREAIAALGEALGRLGATLTAEVESLGDAAPALARRAAAARADLAHLFAPEPAPPPLPAFDEDATSLVLGLGETLPPDGVEGLAAEPPPVRLAPPAFVRYAEARAAGGSALSIQPVEPAFDLARTLFAERKAVVLCSATLSVRGRFDYVKARLGLGAEAREAVFESPFDFATQARVYLPQGLPAPEDGRFVEAMVAQVRRLCALTQGRAFVLFTSHRNLQAVHARLAVDFPWPLFKQGDAPRTRLVEAFRQTAGSVLLGTSSFWEGVDVPGDALSLVIIDRIPFASPGDPVFAARLEAARLAGGNPFSQLQLPAAALTLKQGVGRLLRTRSDRGIVALLDPRLSGRGYGKSLLAALPPVPRLTDFEALAHWWRTEATPPEP